MDEKQIWITGLAAAESPLVAADPEPDLACSEDPSTYKGVKPFF